MNEEVNVGKNNKACRDSWIKKRLEDIPDGSRILDAGAGEQRLKSYCKHLSYVAQDFGRYHGKGDGTGLQPGEWDQSRLDIVCDITDIPEADDSFDAILCVEVLEHLPSPVDALRELARLLKPGGSLILTAPFCSLTHFSPFYFHSGFSPYFYEKWLVDLGFDIVSLEANGNFFEYLAQELRRIPSVAGKYCEAENISGVKKYLRRKAMEILLSWLQNLSRSDQKSSELLCFGYHVLASKR